MTHMLPRLRHAATVVGLVAASCTCGVEQDPVEATPSQAPDAVGERPSAANSSDYVGDEPARPTPFWDRADGEPLPDNLRCTEDPPELGCAVRVAGGRAVLGAQADDPAALGFDPDATPDEGPVTVVAVEGFWLQAMEVHAKVVESCLASGFCTPEHVDTASSFATVGVEERGGHPANGLTWAGAQQVCAYLGGRLPTSAEWSLAARTEAGWRFPWGGQAACWQWLSDDALDQGDGAEVIREACSPVLAAISRTRGSAVADRLGALAVGLEPAAVAGVCAGTRVDAVDDAVAALEAGLLALPRRGQAPAGSVDCAATDRPVDVERARPGIPHASLPDGRRVGFRGLAGNVAEWVADAHPPGEDGRPRRRLHGGGWTGTSPVDWRAAAWSHQPEDVQAPDVGVRCAWDVAVEGE